MKLVNKAAEIHHYDTEKEWAKDMRKGLKRDLKIYKKQISDHSCDTNTNEYLEGIYVSSFLDWFLNNYFE